MLIVVLKILKKLVQVLIFQVIKVLIKVKVKVRLQEDFACSTNNMGEKKNDTIIALVMYEIIHGVEISLEKSEVLTIRDVINVYKEKLNEGGGEDN